MAIAVWKLGIAIMQVCRAINHVLLQRAVTLGSVQEIVDDFAAMWFQNCHGVIDGTHIPILIPDHLVFEVHQQKRLLFYVLASAGGSSGSFHQHQRQLVREGTHIFRNTGLYRKLQAGTSFPCQGITIGDVEMPVVILEDPAYPLLLWLMKSYTGHLDGIKEHFISRRRTTVECAFSRLKGCW